MRRVVLALLASVWAACGAEGVTSPDAGAGAAPVDLVTSSGWRWMPAGTDPWAAHVDPARPCSPSGLLDEDAFFEIDTRLCSAASVSQPIAAAIHPDDEIRALVWHLALVADAPAMGHVALTLGGETLVDETVPIPSDEAVFEVRRRAGFSASAGTEAVFHVHNHGYNNWRVAYVRVLPR